ncbi:MAG: hypothetical protein WD825_12940 [Gemmatimonadaceae bacterium]
MIDPAAAPIAPPMMILSRSPPLMRLPSAAPTAPPITICLVRSALDSLLVCTGLDCTIVAAKGNDCPLKRMRSNARRDAAIFKPTGRSAVATVLDGLTPRAIAL